MTSCTIDSDFVGLVDTNGAVVGGYLDGNIVDDDLSLLPNDVSLNSESFFVIT